MAKNPRKMLLRSSVLLFVLCVYLFRSFKNRRKTLAMRTFFDWLRSFNHCSCSNCGPCDSLWMKCSQSSQVSWVSDTLVLAVHAGLTGGAGSLWFGFCGFCGLPYSDTKLLLPSKFSLWLRPVKCQLAAIIMTTQRRECCWALNPGLPSCTRSAADLSPDFLTCFCFLGVITIWEACTFFFWQESWIPEWLNSLRHSIYLLWNLSGKHLIHVSEIINTCMNGWINERISSIELD